MMKRIAITMRTVEAPETRETRDAISHDWVRFLNGLGYAPVFIPNGSSYPIAYLAQDRIQALILSGGNDVALGRPDPTSRKETLSAQRDETERVLLHYAIEKKIPVLGVCRGMQFLNLFFQGTLRPIDSFSPHPQRHRCRFHRIHITEPRYAAFLGESARVNSYHNYGLQPEDLADELRIFAVDREDNLCEGLFHPALPLLGVQWHPERTHPAQDRDASLIRSFLEGKG